MGSHRGFQTASTRPQWRAKQQEENNHRFDEFAKEVSAHYSADPYKMLDKLDKMNLKNAKVSYKKKSDKKRESGEKRDGEKGVAEKLAQLRFFIFASENS